MLVLDSAALRRALPPRTAVQLIRDALRDGLDPEAEAPRTAVPVTAGSMLLMPAEWRGHLGVKLVTVDGRPHPVRARVQGTYALFDAQTLTPIGLLDATELTRIRTAAVSALALDTVASSGPVDLVVFGSGVQAGSHLRAIASARELARVRIVARDRGKLAAFLAELAAEGISAEPAGARAVGEASVVVCATTSRSPLFDGTALRDDAMVIAIGSHEPDAREVDSATVGRSYAIVESMANSSRENGNLLLAQADGVVPRGITTLSRLVREPFLPPPGPTVYLGSGMAWQDLVLASHCITLTA
ncbi:MAG TPA: ornithine cyclodeaminase family protein [Pseudolysinimonas sp.]|nr:ornithine cyclodeaminase family protein [Pseudolysinimonas sp.]